MRAGSNGSSAAGRALGGWIAPATNAGTLIGADGARALPASPGNRSVFFQESKQHLGPGDYHLLRYRGLEQGDCTLTHKPNSTSAR
jgi:hypothetical protein